MYLTPESAASFLEDHPEIKRVDVYIIDLNGFFRGKRISARQLVNAAASGVRLPLSIFASDITGNTVEETGLGLDTGDTDYACRPLADSLTIAPWDPTLALAQLDMLNPQGESAFADPMTQLERMLDRFQEKGLVVDAGIELEFYLLDKDRSFARGSITGRQQLTSQVYGLKELDDSAPFFDAAEAALQSLDIEAEAVSSEAAPGQYEITLHHHRDISRLCRDVSLVKRTLRNLAPAHGLLTTFMAKPFAELSGNGLHLHVSLADESGSGVFKDEEGPNELLANAIGGVLDTLGESMLANAPHGNSYRRFLPNAYAPVTASWGRDNRSVAIRIPNDGDARFEHRVASTDTNPYLVASAVLAGALHGLDSKAKLPPAATGNTYRQQQHEYLPAGWDTAIDVWAAAEILPRYFDPQFMHLYSILKRAEYNTYLAQIPPVDFDWYFEA